MSQRCDSGMHSSLPSLAPVGLWKVNPRVYPGNGADSHSSVSGH